MILTCPACSTRYLTDAGSFTSHGRTVRCAKCSHTWYHETPSEADSKAVVPHTQQGRIPGVVTGPRPLTPDALRVPKRKHHNVPLAMLALLSLCALFATLYQYREAVAQAVPQLRPVYAGLGIPVGGTALEFRNVNFRWADPEDRTRLEVWGEVVNTGRRSQTIPPIRISMRDANAVELYARMVTLSRRTLEAGASNSFSIALENPPDGARDLTVDFFRKAP